MSTQAHYYISYEDKNLAYLNIKRYDFKQEGFTPIPYETLEKIDFEGLHNLLMDLTTQIEQDAIQPSRTDRLIGDQILQLLPFSLAEAGNALLWNGLSVIDDTLYEFIQKRWGHTKHWFRSHYEPVQKDYTQIRRYVTRTGVTELPRGTLPRIWWAARLVGREYQETLWRQQDLVDNLLERTIANIDEAGNLDRITKVFFRKLKQKEEEARINRREAVVRQLLKWMVGFQNYLITEAFNETEVDEKMEEMFAAAFTLVQQSSR